MRVLLITPPMLDLNSPYPATAYLKGYLSRQGYDVLQADFALELALKLFSQPGIGTICAEVQRTPETATPSPQNVGSFGAKHLLANRERYRNTIEPVVRFLQGKDPSLAFRICTRRFLPEGPRFLALREPGSGENAGSTRWALGSFSVQDRARYLASLYIGDICDVIQYLDPKFTLFSYAEMLASQSQNFDPLESSLHASHSIVDRYLDELTCDAMRRLQPDVIGITVPFRGNLYGAFRIARTIKEISPGIRTVLGGGYVNTELRQLSDPRIFDYVDFVTLDDGEKPLACLLEHVSGKRSVDHLFRTFVREKGKVCFKNDPACHDIPHSQTGIPSYHGLSLASYIPVCDALNPMLRVFFDARWNKLTLAHGCYWKKCSFCDVSLDYIGRYDPASVDVLIDRIQALIQETGVTGFHFVDEAAPPALLRALAERLIENGIVITWWGNIRFEKAFSPELVELMVQSGCVAVTGGLEVASDRLLQLMKKGITVEQVARVARTFADAGILVHAYLMYGFPTQTQQETIDSLELVRQLFAAKCIQSAFWHRFTATVHSPVGLNPDEYGIQILPSLPATFAAYGVDFADPTGCDHDLLGHGLNRALQAYLLGKDLNKDVHLWFQSDPNQPPVPKTTVAANFIDLALQGMPSGPPAMAEQEVII